MTNGQISVYFISLWAYYSFYWVIIFNSGSIISPQWSHAGFTNTFWSKPKEQRKEDGGINARKIQNFRYKKALNQMPGLSNKRKTGTTRINFRLQIKNFLLCLLAQSWKRSKQKATDWGQSKTHAFHKTLTRKSSSREKKNHFTAEQFSVESFNFFASTLTD